MIRLRYSVCLERRSRECLFLIKRFERAIKLRVAMCKFSTEWFYDRRRPPFQYIRAHHRSITSECKSRAVRGATTSSTISSRSYFIIALFIQSPKSQPATLFESFEFLHSTATPKRTDKECRKKSEAKPPTHTYTPTTPTRPSIYERYSRFFARFYFFDRFSRLHQSFIRL